MCMLFVSTLRKLWMCRVLCFIKQDEDVKVMSLMTDSIVINTKPIENGKIIIFFTNY